MLPPRPSPRACGAGASAYAQYRAALAEGRPRRLLVRTVLTLAAAVAVSWVWGWRVGLAAAVLVAVADTVHRWRTHEAVRTWRKGALGERRTARMLRPLARRGYTILHDRAIPGSRANVDHLVIGGGGVFVVDTKHWGRDRRVTRRGRYVRVGRASGDQVARAVRYEAARVSELLTRSAGRRVEVTPVLAIHGPSVPMLRVMKANGVPMLRASQVRGWIARRPVRLSPAETAALIEAAGRLLPPYTG